MTRRSFVAALAVAVALAVPAFAQRSGSAPSLQDELLSGRALIRMTANVTLTQTLLIPGGVTLDADNHWIKKGADCDLIQMDGGAQLLNARVSGYQFLGRGIVWAQGTDQRILNCNVNDMAGYCLEIIGASTGARGTVNGGLWCRADWHEPAIKLPDAESNGDRRFINIDCGGGCLIDLAGSATTIIGGCGTTNIVFGAACCKAIVTGCRIANSAGNLIVRGMEHVIVGNCLGGGIENYSRLSKLEPNVFADGKGVTNR